MHDSWDVVDSENMRTLEDVMKYCPCVVWQRSRSLESVVNRNGSTVATHQYRRSQLRLPQLQIFDVTQEEEFSVEINNKRDPEETKKI